jgi:SAM-dependent methyltransferase
MRVRRRAARMLLDGLVALELVEKTDGRYRNGPTASACLVPGRPGYQGFYLRHMRGSMEPWLRLGEAVRHGGAAVERPERPPEQLRNFILAMSELGRLSAQQLADAVDLSPYRHVLDVGGGPGTYSIVFLERHPAMRATVLDRPPVIEIAKEQVAKAGLEGRFAYIPGDMLETDFGTGYDLVLVSNVIHMLGPEANRRLMRRAFDALEPGGRLIVKDFLLDDDRSGPAFSLIFALHMLVNTGEGDTYRTSEVAQWTRDAGFEDAGEVELTPRTKLWLARKP